MANLTITVDDDVVRRARIRALHHNESVNKYLAQVLERYADAEENDAASGFLDLIGTFGTGHVGAGRGWSRDELHRV